MLHIQQQRYITTILHNITMHTCPICIIHGSDLIIKDTNLTFCIVILVAFLTHGQCILPFPSQPY
jgi:hypothetical protein